ncbi:cold shock domain-containing protein [Roseivirga sp. BDSF3-8]|uniref:cold shock domain-containing protein n=1 Tax=Roseivirga sp. BDSF3-8 TaxID=3241598 RepID=UPI003532199B
MADTWSKKEKQKKKAKKKEEKAAKKAERRENAADGNNLDEMMAYVDEFGNISDTPPDPTFKKKVKKEDIQVSVPKQEDIEPLDTVRRGKVTFFNESKGYGFIRDMETQESIFVHISDLEDQVMENDRVNFEVEMTHKGPNARKVTLEKK